jgi:hypothetical protein
MQPNRNAFLPIIKTFITLERMMFELAVTLCPSFPPGRQVALVLLVLVATTLLFTSAQYCPPGAITICDSVLIIYVASDFSSGAVDVKAKLQETKSFVTIDLFDAESDTPSTTKLAAYDAVLVYNNGNGAYQDSTLLGDNLAAYHDQGGGVVVSAFANFAGGCLKGAYGTVANGYALLDYSKGDRIAPMDSMDKVVPPQDPASPLLMGVTSLTAISAWRSTAPIVNKGIVVAKWKGGSMEPLVVRGTRRNRTLVELNFFPPPRNEVNAPWSWIGDGDALLRNALKFSRCKICQPGTFAAAGEALRDGSKQGEWGHKFRCQGLDWSMCAGGDCVGSLYVHHD